MKELLDQLGLDYLLVNSTNKYLTEYSELSENARYTLTGFTGSTGDALITSDSIYLFVDGRYHTQAEQEVKDGITVVKLELGQNQDDEIKKLINPEKTLGIVAKKVSQSRLEKYSGYNVKLLVNDPVNDYTEPHGTAYEKSFAPVDYRPNPTFVSALEEVSYITGMRDFSKQNSVKVWCKLFIEFGRRIILKTDEECEKFLRGYNDRIIVDKSSINAYDYALIKYPMHKPSEIKKMMSVKSEAELKAYKDAFFRTDKAIMAIRSYIENNENLSEYDIAERLKKEFYKYGAKSTSFNPIVAINKNSALAHYSKNSPDVILKDGDLVLIDCGAYYQSGLATDITRVFVKGQPNELQKKVYTTVLKAFLNCYNMRSHIETPTFEQLYCGAKREKNFAILYGKDTDKAVGKCITGYEIDSYAHTILDDAVEGFVFSHGLGHGIGINVHETPPNLSQNEIARTPIDDGMCFTIEPGLYNPEQFGVRLENSCYKQDGKFHSFVKTGYEGKLIDYSLLNQKEKEWLKEFKVL